MQKIPIQIITLCLVTWSVLGCTTTMAESPPRSEVVTQSWEILAPPAYQVFAESDTTETCMVVRSTDGNGEGRGCVNHGEPLPTVTYWTPLETKGGDFLVGASSDQVTTLVLRVDGQPITIPFSIQGEITSVGVRLPQEPDQYQLLDADGNVIFPE